MRDHYPYPRKRWHTALGVTTLLLSLGIALGYGIPVNNHQSDINHAQATANAVSDTNHLWNMVGGVEAVDGGDLGRVAAKVREFNNAEPNPLAALQDHYIAPGELPDLGNRLGFTAYSNNHFTDQFLFQAIQAMGVVKGGSAADVVKPVPSVPSYGYLRWDWGLYGLGGLWTLAGLIWLVLRYDKKRYPARARAKEIAALSPEARKTFHIIQRLEEMPANNKKQCKERDQLLEQARQLFAAQENHQDSTAELNQLKALLQNQINESQSSQELRKLTQAAYNELNQPS